MNETSLKDRVIAGLRALPRSIPYTKVAEDTDVGHSWICMLVNEKIDDPGVKKLEKLNEYLKQYVNPAA
jgi:hypothetical protein